MLAVVGPSGSGKSTLVDLILGILTPTAGIVELSGISPNEAVSIWPGKIGYVPQYVNLLNNSVSRNLQLGFTDGEIDTNLMLEALELAQLSELELELNIGENGSKLSGGQRQRIGIARALLLKPDLLILDEATSALDSETEFAISTALENLRAKVTLIVVAHRLSTVKSASRIAYIEDGWMKDTGTFAEIRARIPAFDSQAKLMGL
jgi:ABC-type bacteriocin/lantibiotic exporter with double-glycine peptidase domain